MVNGNIIVKLCENEASTFFFWQPDTFLTFYKKSRLLDSFVNKTKTARVIKFH